MSWEFKYFRGNYNGVIDYWEPVTGIMSDFSFEETVGDEFYIKAGDLSLSMLEPLPFVTSAGTHNWLAVYWNGVLYNVYHIGSYLIYDKSFEEKDDKKNLYKTRLPSIQNFFFKNIRDFSVNYQVISEGWSYNLSNAKVVISELRIDEAPATKLDDRWGFSLGDMLANIDLKTNSFGYRINGYSIPLPMKNEDNLPILFRGRSLDSSDTEANAVHYTFEDYDVKWKDIFETALYARNAFLKITPAFSSGDTQLDVRFDIIPKVSAGSQTAIEVEWRERKKTLYKYQIKGVKIDGSNFEYTQGNIFGDNIFSRSLPIGNPPQQISASDENLYLAEGDYNSGSGEYEILDSGWPAGNNVGWWKEANIESYYEDMISAGHGYDGEVTFDGEKPLDQTLIGSERIQFTSVRFNKRRIANVEGAVI